ncbi:MAG: ThuA domain-containing protein [Anaerolineales bacterium]
MDKRALLLLGGTWHDFEGFRQRFTPLLNGAGYAVEPTYEMQTVLDLAHEDIDLVVQYTSFGVHERFPDAAPGFTPEQALALSDWVSAGGRLLGVHGASVIGPAPNSVHEALVGARFIEHPAQFAFTVYPIAREHPVIAGVEALAVHDEFYLQEYAPDLAVHMVAIDRGRAYPMVWTRQQGEGRVAYVAMGHSDQVWGLPGYVQLLTNAVSWLGAQD